MSDNLDYKVGDIIRYRLHGGSIRTVKITERLADVKNGCPGFDGQTIGGRALPLGGWDTLTCWGYDDQIIEVLTPQGKELTHDKQAR